MGRPKTRTLVRVIQVAVAVILVAGVLARNPSVAVNAALGLAVTFLPAFLRRDRHLHLSVGASLWIAVAVFLHTIGMTGIYQEVWWYDHLTHAFSASLVAAAGYATVRALDEHRDDLYFPRPFLVVFILLVTLALGVVWELAEWGAREVAFALSIDPVLTVYGLDDTLLDLVFDALGAVVAATVGARHLRGDVAALTDWLDD